MSNPTIRFCGNAYCPRVARFTARGVTGYEVDFCSRCVQWLEQLGVLLGFPITITPIKER